MYKASILCLAAILLFASCSGDPSVAPVNAVVAFKDRKVELSANSDRAISDRPVTFTLRCYPQVTGVGRMCLDGWGAGPGTLLFIQQPARDTLDITNSRFEYPVVFTTGVPCDLQVEVQMQPGRDYFYSATAFLDSVFIPDSNRLFYFNSSVARAYSGRAGGYDAVASYDRTFPLYWKP
jgi:hypothetical protein